MNAERVGLQRLTSHSASTVRTPFDSDEVEAEMIVLLWENQDLPKFSKLRFVDGTISKEMRKRSQDTPGTMYWLCKESCKKARSTLDGLLEVPISSLMVPVFPLATLHCSAAKSC